MMAPDHVAKESQRDEATDHHPRTAEQGLADIGAQNVRHDSEPRYDRDVHFRMAEEPEQVLPEQGRTAGILQHLVTHHHAGRIEEASAERAIENQKDASREQVCERKQPDARGYEPGPSGKWHARERHAFCSQVQGRGDEV